MRYSTAVMHERLVYRNVLTCEGVHMRGKVCGIHVDGAKCLYGP